MMLDSVLMLAGFVCQAMAPNVEVFLLGELRVLVTSACTLVSLFAGRLLTGHSAGSNLVSCPIFVSEISHPDMRGTTSVMTMVCYTSGFFLSMLAGASLPWRTAAWVFVTTPLLSFGLLLLCRVNGDPGKLDIITFEEYFRNLPHGSSEMDLRKQHWIPCSFTEEILKHASEFLYHVCEIMMIQVYTFRKELESIKTSINDLKPDQDMPIREKYKHTLKRLLSKEFLKPFLFLNLILNIGLEWAGFPALAFYMHTILKQMEIPLDEYWVAVALAGYRSALTVGLSFVLYKVTLPL